MAIIDSFGFKLFKLVEKVRERNGYCMLHDSEFATIDGFRTNCTTGVSTPVKVHWICDWNPDGTKTLRLLDGVTGFEVWYIDHLIDYALFEDNSPFCACAGTPGRWDGLVLDLEQVRAIVRQLDSLQ